jgi:hypothetical protein
LRAIPYVALDTGAALILSRVCEGREAGSPLREAVTLEVAYRLAALVREEGLSW